MASHAQALRIQPFRQPEPQPGWCGRTVDLVERLHRRLQDLVKDELDRRGILDINSVQALILYHFNEESLAAGDLRSRGHYQGTNVSHNLKKLAACNYIDQKRSSSDKRSIRLTLTAKGESVRDALQALFCRHDRTIGASGDMPSEAMAELNQMMGRLERFWVDQVRFQL